MEGKTRFKVFVRVKPAADGQPGVCKLDHRLITVHDPGKEHSSEFVFDSVHGPAASQQALFNDVAKPLVEHVMNGYNACCFAYGQTGSGKTYTMFGKETGEPELRGIIPRAVEEVFKVANELKHGSTVHYDFFVSFLEIYLEQVRDLGSAAMMATESGGKLDKRELDKWSKSNLDVMEDAAGQTSVKDLAYIQVNTPEDVLRVLHAGAALRTTASTTLNDLSSRSHTVFTISVVQYRDGIKPVTGRLHLVDLAGSERQSKTNSEGQRLTEAKAINKSLTALGKVVMALSQNEDGGHVPFRDSKLTRILKDSLQGNSLTCMLAALNPLTDNAEECFNTLQFAVRCQNINLAPHINVVGPGGGLMAGGGDEMIEQLQQQIAALQEELNFTHAHYQKILESVAGPGWMDHIGPVERVNGVSGDSISGSSSAIPSAESMRLRSATSIREVGSDNVLQRANSMAPGAWNGTGSADQRIRRLEMQLEAARGAQKDAEDAVLRAKFESDETRDRLLGKERVQFTEIRKLRQRVNELQTKVEEIQVEAQHKLDEAARSHEDEVVRLNKDCEKLRAQLAQLSGALPGVMEARSQRATAEARTLQAAKAEADRVAAQQLAVISSEKERQVDNLKQQSNYFLKTKSEEAHKLAAELAALRVKHTEEVEALHAECEYVAEYAERVTQLLRQAESGGRPAGVRVFKLPARDRPAQLDSARLTYLKSASSLASRLVEASAAAAAGPALSSPTAGSTAAAAVNTANSLASGAEVDAACKAASESAAEATAPGYTAEYVQSLEAAVAQYRQEIVGERKRLNSMNVALKSAQRCSGRPGSAIQETLQGGVLVMPPRWGFGHTHLTTRPATASPRLEASGRFTPRPGTATAMQLLASSFRDNGLPC